MKIGIDLGGSHIAIGVVDNNLKIVEKVEKRITYIEKKNIKKSIEEYIFQEIKVFAKKYDIESIGLAIPGTVQDGKILKSVNLGIKEKYDIKSVLEKNIKNIKNIPIKIKNDAKCAALAENKKGSLKAFERTVFLTLGTGIGGAVIINNELLNAGPLSGCEFGHMILEVNGKKCKCGKKGCFETYGSMKVLKNNLRKVLGVDEKTRGEELLSILRNIKNGDEHYEEIEETIQTYIKYLAIGISNLVNVFEPEAIGIGGSFVFFEDVLLERLKKYMLKENLLFNKRQEIKIMSAVLRNDAGMIGATLLNNLRHNKNV